MNTRWTDKDRDSQAQRRGGAEERGIATQREKERGGGKEEERESTEKKRNQYQGRERGGGS